MKKKAKKLTLAKTTLQNLEGTITGGWYFDINSNTAGLDNCICPRMINPRGGTGGA